MTEWNEFKAAAVKLLKSSVNVKVWLLVAFVILSIIAVIVGGWSGVGFMLLEGVLVAVAIYLSREKGAE